MMSGVGLATVVGVPLGSWTGQHLGWRGSFWGLAVLAGIAALIIGRFVPGGGQGRRVTVGSQLGVLRSGRLWLLLAGTVFVTGGYMATFSYISPLLTDKAGFSTAAIPLVLVGYGVGSLLGANAGGRLADHEPLATFIGAAVATAIVMTLIVLLSGRPVAAVVLVVLLGVAGMAVPPVATGLAVQFAGSAPTLAAGLAVAAFNGGIALGSWIAGNTLDSSLGATGPALIGAVLAVIGLIPLLALAAARATSRGAGRQPAPAEHTTIEPATPVHAASTSA
jgi:DHA1 family inner membrane transport protein